MTVLPLYVRSCVPHWMELAERVVEADLGHLIAVDAERAATLAERMMTAEEDDFNEIDFEPVVFASMQLTQLLIAVKGVAALSNGEMHCPVCELAVHDWNTGAAASARAVADRMGLLL